MSLPRETMMDLMALADGELDGEAKAHAESLASANPEARRFVLSIEHDEVGAFLASAFEERAGACHVDTIAETVLARIRSLENRGADGALVQGLGERPLLADRAVSLSRRRPGEPDGREAATRSWRSSPRWRTAAVCGALALAAGVAFYVGRRPRMDDTPPEATKLDLAPPATSTRLARETPIQGVEVDEIDSPVHDISVFEITGSAAAAAANPSRPSSIVIWVEDEPGAK
jgi:hypothetical protein